MAGSEDITKLDLFEFLGVNDGATEQEIKKAFRKQALTCHPDKNPDNPKAAELFQKLSKATEILLDPPARAAYERVLRARKERAVRHRHLDSKRKKLKDDLESREKAAKDDVETELDAAQKLAQEIERLRKEGSKELERQNEELQRQVEKELKDISLHKERLLRPDTFVSDVAHRVRAKWKKRTPYDEESLRKHLSRFGDIAGLAISRKGTSAIIEFKSDQEAQSAISASSDDLVVEAIDANPAAASTTSQSEPLASESKKSDVINENPLWQTTFAAPQFAGFPRNQNDDDNFESSVLLKLKRAQERKRLADELQGQ